MIANHSKPVAQAERITAVDILRGVAVLGILLMNIPYFALPESFSDVYHSDLHSPNFWSDFVVTVLFEGKMRALFSMIFGAGILLFIERKKNVGANYKGLFLSRMGWLVLFGLIHAHVLLWMGDILYYYGLIGMLAFLFRNMKAKYLVWGVPIVAIIGFVTGTQFFQHVRHTRLEYNTAVALQKQNKPLSVEQKTAITNWQEMEKEFLPNQTLINQHTASMKGDYNSVASYVRPLSWDGQTKYLIYSIGDILALFMLGMALYKWKFFSSGWSTKQYRRTALIGYGIGLPLVLVSFYHSYLQTPGSAAEIHFIETNTVPWWGIIYPFQRIFLVMAHASAVLLLIRAGAWSWLMVRLSAVGQMAFTNYIMQTVICSLFFFGYGLNYFAELQYYQLFYLVAAIWLFQLIVSPIWLKYFLFGPLEWLWRTLTYRRLQPMLRKQEVLNPLVGIGSV
ncbi:MAG: DUF418 domain-containing protein [Pedobacter sp.]